MLRTQYERGAGVTTSAKSPLKSSVLEPRMYVGRDDGRNDGSTRREVAR